MMSRKSVINRKEIMVLLIIFLLLTLSIDVSAGRLDWFKKKYNALKGGLTAIGKKLGSDTFIEEGIAYFSRVILVYKIVYGGFLPKYAESFPNNFYVAILSNPSPYKQGIFNFMGLLIRILQPAYSLFIMIIGFYLLFMPISPSARSKAKTALIRLLISMVIISLSIPITNFMLNISKEITESVFSLISLVEIKKVLFGAVHNVFWMYALANVGHTDIGLPYLMLLFAMAFIPYMVIALRYILVTLLVAIFPLSVFLYSIPWFRGIGKRMLEQMIVWTFLQIFIALIIVVFTGIGITIEEYFVNNARISFTNLRAMYDIVGAGAVAAPFISIGSWFGTLGIIISGLIGGALGYGVVELGLHSFYKAMPATLSIVDFVLGIIIYAMLIIFPLVWSHMLHDFLP